MSRLAIAGGRTSLAVALLQLLAAGQAMAGPAVSCPPIVQARYEQLRALSPDDAGAGLRPYFQHGLPATVRLVEAQLGLAHAGEGAPSEALPPDELAFSIGRPMNWTLWNGLPPEPRAEVHVICHYEGGMMLYKPLGRRIRGCSLETQPVQQKRPRKASKVSPEEVLVQAPGVRAILAKVQFRCR
jgi:hypothetical protein